MSAVEQIPNALLGIDVSHWQGEIEWDKVVESGVKFAWIKATEGNSLVDQCFQKNWHGAAAVDIPFGFYHVWRSGMSGQEDHFLETVDAVPHGFLVALDVEPGAMDDDTQSPGLAWMETVSEANPNPLISEPFIYASPLVAQVSLTDPAWLQYPLWVAHYTQAPQPNIGKWPKWTFWQRQCDGEIPGVPNLCDVDWFNGSVQDFNSLFGIVPQPVSST